MSISAYLRSEADAALEAALSDRRSELERPRIVVQRPGTRNPEPGVLTHEALPRVLAALEVVGCCLLIGPSGCGKSRLVEDAGKALGYEEPGGFEPITLSEGVGEHHLLGRVLPSEDGRWNFQPGPVTRAYESGGLLFLDELDAAEPNAILSLNSALSGDLLPLPMRGNPAKRHEKFLYAGAMNTKGLGADGLHSGRRGQDAAMLNRFTGAKVMVGYDRALEIRLAERYLEPGKAKRVVDFVDGLRCRIERDDLPRVASTRLVERMAMMLAAGLPWDEVTNYERCDWDEDGTALA